MTGLKTGNGGGLSEGRPVAAQGFGSVFSTSCTKAAVMQEGERNYAPESVAAKALP